MRTRMVDPSILPKGIDFEPVNEVAINRLWTDSIIDLARRCAFVHPMKSGVRNGNHFLNQKLHLYVESIQFYTLCSPI
jgi:hypothetical protein